MVDVGKQEWDQHQIDAGQKLMGVNGWKVADALLEGGLWVDAALATDQEVDGEVDPSVTPLLLPYSKSADINLLGAPSAFVLKREQYIYDTQEIISNFPKDIQAAKAVAEQQYKDDTKARSLISIPVPGRAKLIGVLNIYRNAPGIMGSQARARNFSRLMSPFVRLIGESAEKSGVTL